MLINCRSLFLAIKNTHINLRKKTSKHLLLRQYSLKEYISHLKKDAEHIDHYLTTLSTYL